MKLTVLVENFIFPTLFSPVLLLWECCNLLQVYSTPLLVFRILFNFIMVKNN